MTTDSIELPPLPKPPSYESLHDDAPLTDHYSAHQMREYAILAIQQERSRCARVAECENLRGTFTKDEREYWGELIAAAIRSQQP